MMLSRLTNSGYQLSIYFMLALFLPVTIACVDVMAVSVAIAPIMKSFSCTLETSQWLLSGYTIGTAAFLITIGKLADHYGRRKLLMIGVLLFAVSSLSAALSFEIYCLIFSRFLQGVASSVMMTTAMSIITHEFKPEDRKNVISAYGVSLGLGLALGPVIGGLLIYYFDWQAIFLINLPICIFAAVLIMKYIPESKSDIKSRVDWLETLVLTFLLLLLVTIISQGSVYGWVSGLMLYSYLLFLVVLAGFLYIEQSKENPIIDLSLFFQPNYFGATACGFLSYFCMYAWLCIIGIYMQNVIGLTALQTGLFCIPFSLAFSFGARALSHLFKRYTNKLIMQMGFVLSIIAFFWMATITPSTNQATMLIMFFMLGIGITIINSPSMVAAIEYVPINKSGLASGLIFTIRWLGGSIGIIIVTLIYHGFSDSLAYACIAMACAALLGLLLTFSLKYKVLSP